MLFIYWCFVRKTLLLVKPKPQLCEMRKLHLKCTNVPEFTRNTLIQLIQTQIWHYLWNFWRKVWRLSFEMHLKCTLTTYANSLVLFIFCNSRLPDTDDGCGGSDVINLPVLMATRLRPDTSCVITSLPGRTGSFHHGTSPWQQRGSLNATLCQGK